MLQGWAWRSGRRKRRIKKDTRTREEMRREWQELKKKFKVI